MQAYISGSILLYYILLQVVKFFDPHASACRTLCQLFACAQARRIVIIDEDGKGSVTVLGDRVIRVFLLVNTRFNNTIS